jgi:hypothetical protein
MKYKVFVTYTDKFVIEAEGKDSIRKSLRKNWQKFGVQFDKARIELLKKDEDGPVDFVVSPSGDLLSAID